MPLPGRARVLLSNFFTVDAYMLVLVPEDAAGFAGRT